MADFQEHACSGGSVVVQPERQEPASAFSCVLAEVFDLWRKEEAGFPHGRRSGECEMNDASWFI